MRPMLCLVAILTVACAPSQESFDILIVNGDVYDGSLNTATKTNIGIIADRIVSMDAAANAAAKTIIDASDKMVVPGFIDPHTHAMNRLLDPATSANLNYLHQGVTTVFIGSDGGGVRDRRARFAKLRQQGIGPNVAFFAGHGAIREAVMGLADRRPTADELQSMRDLVNEEMQAGAVGLSTGLFYAPGSYSDTAEVIELAKVAAAAGGVYDSHLRSESSHADGVLAAIEEAISIAREANIPVHISHIKALGQDVWGQSAAIVDLVDSALDSGLKISANQYPWSASGTRFSNALIPRWVMADSPEKMAERLFDPALRPRIDAEMLTNLKLRGGPDAMLVTNAASENVGKTLAEIAVALNTDPLQAAITVVLAGDPSIASFVMNQDDIDHLAIQRWVMTGSDGSSGHPRLYGTYPKVWRDFVADRDLLRAEQFVYRSSGLVADTFSLCDRGYLREGFVADIAVIDPAAFAANADYRRPTELSRGVAHLLVNGIAVINDTYTSKLPGQILEMTSCR